MMRAVLLVVLVASFCIGCTTSSTGRSQLRLFPEAEMAQMGATAFTQMKSEKKISGSQTLQNRARCVAAKLAAQITGPYSRQQWEVTVFEDATPNAFALPGGKIGVHSGLFDVAKNQHQLAAVMGHEIAHVLEGHANERVSTQYATQGAIGAVSILTGGPSPAKDQLLGMLGTGAVVLPFGRAQESESDQVGLRLMARAGFDPAQSIALWQNMAKAGGGQPPEFMSTHPSHGTRIANLQAWQAEANQLRAAAQQRGLRPSCY